MLNVYELHDDQVIEVTYMGDGMPVTEHVTVLDPEDPRVLEYLVDKQKNADLMAIRRFEKQRDELLINATTLSQSLTYASKKNKLTDSLKARLVALDDVISQLTVLEYADNINWPAIP